MKGSIPMSHLKTICTFCSGSSRKLSSFSFVESLGVVLVSMELPKGLQADQTIILTIWRWRLLWSYMFKALTLFLFHDIKPCILIGLPDFFICSLLCSLLYLLLWAVSRAPSFFSTTGSWWPPSPSGTPTSSSDTGLL